MISPASSVEFDGVTKCFASVTAVDDLSLSIPKGSIYGFIGPNGSGKTTTMRMIAGIFFPDRGNIHVLDADSSARPLGLIGYLPEERGIYKKMTQKVQFIAAAIGEPKLPILDEPFSGLDPVSSEVIRAAILYTHPLSGGFR